MTSGAASTWNSTIKYTPPGGSQQYIYVGSATNASISVPQGTVINELSAVQLSPSTYSFLDWSGSYSSTSETVYPSATVNGPYSIAANYQLTTSTTSTSTSTTSTTSSTSTPSFVNVYDTSNFTLKATIPLLPCYNYNTCTGNIGPSIISASKVIFNPDGSEAYVGYITLTKVTSAPELPSYVDVINTSTNTVIKQIPEGVDPQYVVEGPDGKTLYVPNIQFTGNNYSQVQINLDCISMETDSVIDSLPLVSLPAEGGINFSPVNGFDNIAFSKNGSELYIAGGQGTASTTFYVIDISNPSNMKIKSTVQFNGVAPNLLGQITTTQVN